jgi:hypothetical protein
MVVSDRTFIEHGAENLHLDPQKAAERLDEALSRTHRHKEGERAASPLTLWSGLGLVIRGVDRALATSNAAHKGRMFYGIGVSESIIVAA